MKIIIFIITLLFSFNAMAQTATEIMLNGTTHYEEVMGDITLYTQSYYHKSGDKAGQRLFYKCLMNRKQKPYLWCWEFEDRGIIDPQ